MEPSLLSTLWVEAVLIFALVLLNGFFAGSEIALVSARRNRIQQLADAGDARAARVARLPTSLALRHAVPFVWARGGVVDGPAQTTSPTALTRRPRPGGEVMVV